MVQVDVLWSYGIGASLGVAAARQVAQRPRREDRFSDPYLAQTLLFLALVFAPSGLYLLWNFTSWETMHEGTKTMPAWLVCLFGITNVTQGLLGYWVVERLVRAGRPYFAYLQVIGAYAGMFFVLAHGWDGEGYRRFFSETRADYLAWDGDWSAWLTSEVALTLAAMGLVLVPLLVGLQVVWLRAGDRNAGRAPRGAARLAAGVLATVFVGGLGLALAATLSIKALGVAAGVPLAAAVAAAACLPHGPLYALYRAVGPRLDEVDLEPDARVPALARDAPAAG